MRSSRWSRVAPSLAAIIGLCALVAASSDAAARRSDPNSLTRSQLSPASVQEANPNAIVVRFAEGVPPGQARKVIRDLGGSIKKEHGRSKLWVVEMPDGADSAAVIAALHASGLVEVAALDYTVTAFEAPDDPSYSDQWHLHDTTGGAWAEAAWELAPSAGAGVTVAVIDTGVAFETYTGPAILWSPQQFEPAPDLAGVPIVAPWNFLAGNTHANDDHGHGTHVSGTILQATGNSHGVAGVAHGASLMPIKILDYSGNGSAADLVESIYYAVDNGADVINMSLGFGGTGQPDAYGEVCTEIAGLKQALDYAFDEGVTVVAASGNAGESVVSCPAADHTVIAVGATRYDGQATFYSNSGFALDIAAPGGDPNVDQDSNGQPDGVLQETLCGDAFFMLITGDYSQFCPVYMPGTSMASPHVAGAAALLLGENASLTPLQVRHYLETTARDRGATGRDDTYGWGALDAYAAIAALQSGPPPDITPTPPPPPPPSSGPAAPTSLTAVAASNSAIALTWQDNASNETGYKVERRVGEAAFSQVVLLAANATSYTSTALTAGTQYDFRVRAAGTPTDSVYSNVASETTFPPPAAPSNLVATPLSPTSIRLDWVDNTDEETGFRLERSTNGTSWLLITNVAADTTTFTSSYLAASTTYSYRVRAFAGSTAGDWSAVATATTLPPPPAPSNLVATTTGPGSVALSWTDTASTETGFWIEKSTNGTSFTYVASPGANVTTATVLSLTPGTLHYFRVRAREGSIYSTWSNVATAMTAPAPAAPTDLVATPTGGTTIALSWTDNATNETGYRIERSSNGTSFLALATLPANATSYNSNYLNAGTTYWYRVSALIGTAASDPSNTVSATTGGAPMAPTDLVATALTNTSILLTWADTATGETGFKIERSADGVSYLQIGMTGANTTSFVSGSLTPGTTYWYRVRAYEGILHSAYSAPAQGATLPPPAAPTDVVAMPLSNSSIRLDWTDNATTETGYRVERSLDGSVWSPASFLAANVTTWTNTNLTPGTAYYYRVRAVEGTIYGDWSSVASGTTLPPPAAPSDLMATVLSTASIRLNWVDNSSNEQGFKVERSNNGGTSWVHIATLGVNVTTWTNVSLLPGTTYQYRVRAYEGSGHGAYSNVATATTWPPPADPSDLSAVMLTATTIKLTWTDNSNNEAGFRIERSTNGGASWLPWVNVSANVTTANHTSSAPGTTYMFRVRSYQSTTNSGYSNTVTITP
ncbi:MAG: fibronectin type III domain-containing protein [Dehalococcoidia bacterium]